MTEIKLTGLDQLPDCIMYKPHNKKMGLQANILIIRIYLFSPESTQFATLTDAFNRH